MLVFRRGISEMVYFQFIKHLIVGGAGAIINYSLFNALVWIHVNTIIANTVTNAVIIVTTFLGQKYFTYRNRMNTAVQIPLFLLQSGLYYLLDTTIVYILIDILSMSPSVGKLISISILTPLSFIFNRYVVFNSHQKEIINA